MDLKTVIALGGMVLASAIPLTSTPTAAQTSSFPEGAGREIFETICSSCHSPNAVLDKRWTKQEWQTKVTEMLQEETDVTEDEANTIVGYLSATFPTAVNVNTAKAADIARIAGLPANDADAITSFRTDHGPIHTLEDLKRVPGVNPSRVDAKKERFEF